MATIVAVGIDNGGTWIRLKGLDAKGRCLWSLKKKSPSVDDLPRFLKKSLKPFQGKLPALAIGSRGVWKKSKRQALQRAIQGLAKTIIVMSDVEAAWLAAFPHPGESFALSLKGEGADRPGEGIIIIAGTGSIAYGRRRNGTFARAGGLEPEKGDEGSGHWIAKEWLICTGQNQRASKSVRATASFAPKVLALARRKNPLAAAIVEQAQLELAALVQNLALRLHFKKINVSWAGSLLEDTTFREGFFRALAPLPIIRTPSKTDAATALARSIMGHGHG